MKGEFAVACSENWEYLVHTIWHGPDILFGRGEGIRQGGKNWEIPPPPPPPLKNFTSKFKVLYEPQLAIII